MLRLMAADTDKQAQIHQVHAGAVDYYQRPPATVPRRTEALYHRLMLGWLPDREVIADDVPTDEAIAAGFASLPSGTLDPRPIWLALADAADELPADAVGFLSARLLREVLPDFDWKQADQRDWELLVLGRASRRARERGNVQSALAALERDQQMIQRQWRQLSPGSALRLLECNLHYRLGELDQVGKIVQQTLGEIPRPTALGLRRNAEYGFVLARCAAGLGSAGECQRNMELALEATYELLALSDAGDKHVVVRLQRQLLRFALECCVLLRDDRVESLASRAFSGAAPEAFGGVPALRRAASELLPNLGASESNAAGRHPALQAVLVEARTGGDLLPGEDTVGASGGTRPGKGTL